MLTKKKKEALKLMITLKNRKIESLISDNKGRIRYHLDQLLRERKPMIMENLKPITLSN